MIREFVLQLKRGSIRPGVLPRASTASTCCERFRDGSRSLDADGYLGAAHRRCASR